ncbi:tetratricopeptide repeat protein [Mucilaginibacter lacusdianchii]|uniref:tetratricopeptide repeat protein n=1 Tax=Mucilaginibacter lacusdianchii TaxID=2684211 RepID=UPI00131DAB95|nr:hypothetical protein [Mucilaginibacter sp. JXJ CY 39]
MEQSSQITQESVDTTPVVCLKCGSTQILEGYANPLCADCRTALIKYRVPAGIKLFAAGILGLLVLALALSANDFKLAFALARAEKAETAKKHLTAQRELEKVQSAVPNNTEVAARLMIAAFYNGDLNTYGQLLDKMTGKNLDNEYLLKQVNDLTNEVEAYYPSQAFTKAMAPYEKSPNGVPDSTYRNFIIRQPGDVYARVAYASECVDKENNARADSILKDALAISPTHITALLLRSITLRELNQLDASIRACDGVLAQNKELVMALSSKSRTLLKKGEHNVGLNLALQAEALDTNSPYNKATLAIAYHLNKNFKSRDAILKMSESDSTLVPGMAYAKDVISGKIKFGKP